MRARLGRELRVEVLGVDADTGHVFVSEQVPAGRQLNLPLFDSGATVIKCSRLNWLKPGRTVSAALIEDGGDGVGARSRCAAGSSGTD